jgi:hypothetical protein
MPDNIVKQLMLIGLFVKENFSLVSVKMATGSPKQNLIVCDSCVYRLFSTIVGIEKI